MLIFIEVVENNSFARAADKLHLSESAVSKSLSRLSQKLDISLFFGSGKGWELTPEGKKLYNNWKEHIIPIQECYDRIWNEIHNLPEIKIGISNFIKTTGMFSSSINAFSLIEPDINVSINSESITNLFNHLLSYKYDYIIVPGFTIEEIIKNEIYEWSWIAKSNLSVLIPNSNILSTHDKLTLKELQHETFVHQIPFSYTALLNATGQIKLNTSTPMNPETFRMNFSEYNYLSLVDDFIDLSVFADATKVPLSLSPALTHIQAGLICIWKKDSISSSHKNLLRLLKKNFKLL